MAAQWEALSLRPSQYSDACVRSDAGSSWNVEVLGKELRTVFERAQRQRGRRRLPIVAERAAGGL